MVRGRRTEFAGFRDVALQVGARGESVARVTADPLREYVILRGASQPEQLPGVLDEDLPARVVGQHVQLWPDMSLSQCG